MAYNTCMERRCNMADFGKSCCFTGHRPQKLPWKYDENDIRCIEFKENLSAVINAVYESGITHFICGMALGCDMYCAEAVIELKKLHPDITLEAAVPYDGQESKWAEVSRRRYRSILMHCDKTTLIQDTYTPGCMMRRNRYMVDSANVLIACYDGKSGGTWNTIEYAIKLDKEVIQLPIE